MKRIAIEAMHLGEPYCGLREYVTRIGNGIGSRARKLRESRGVEFVFLVPPGHYGCFGDDVDYIEVTPARRFLYRFMPVKGIDLFHATHQYCKVKHLSGVRDSLMTIHDINFVYEKQGGRLKRAFRRLRGRLAHTDHLAFISDFAHDDTARYFDIDQPVRRIYNGVTDLTGQVDDDSLRGYRLPPDFLFHISAIRPTKNVHLLVEMMDSLPEEHLVIAGNWASPYAAALKERIASARHHNITTLDCVSETQKATLFSRCKAFVFPSLCEGFGLPPIEAMKFGKPVFLSTKTSLPEVGGDVAYFWPELEAGEMAEVVTQGCRDFMADPTAKTEKIKAHAARFDWDACVDGYIDYYLDILDKK